MYPRIRKTLGGFHHQVITNTDGADTTVERGREMDIPHPGGGHGRGGHEGGGDLR